VTYAASLTLTGTGHGDVHLNWNVLKSIGYIDHVTPSLGSGGSRRPTLADVAARAGVSVALVSIVMRDAPGASVATRERVRRAAEELGYRPDSRARLLRSSRSRLIGVVFAVQQAFHGDLVSGLYTAADAADYELALSAVTPARDERRAATSLLQDRCEALILLGPHAPTSYLAELAARMPLVVVARPVRHRAVDVIRTDDAAGLEQAVDHLVALGHTRIVHIDGGRAPGAAERRRGYRQGLQRHGLADSAHILPGGLTEDDGATAAGALLDTDPLPTAVTVFNDRSATGVLDILRSAASMCRATCPSSGLMTVAWRACHTSRSRLSRRTPSSSPASPSPARPLGSTAGLPANAS
jgi:DNA-binding LacI/PurR family transcriptional regulator